MGKNGEPYTLAEDLISQNLLWLAYEKPLTVEELSKAIGIPCAYVEPIVERLVNSEIMKRVGNSVYTDFMISTLEDQERHIPAQVQLAEAHFGAFWNPIQKGLDELRETAYYLRQSEWQRYSLEMYFVFSCLDYGIYRAFSELYDAKVNFPERPDGGSWIAFGNVHFEPFDYRKHMGIMMHSYAGWRWAALDDYLGAKHIELQIYDPEGFPIRTINTNPHWRRSFTEWDADYLRLLWVVHSETDVAATAFNTELLKSIPFLIRLKILREDENGKPRVNAPILSTDELRDMLHRISEDVKKEMIQNLKPVLTEYLKGKEHRLPPHLDSVPLQKRYSHATGALLFAVLRQALRRGKLYDNDFDDDSHDNQPPYPLVLAFE
jgi:RNA polymerase sigma-70 factor (ECF subfamily)